VTYTRDALGRIGSKTERLGSEPSRTSSYSYDLAGRLAMADLYKKEIVQMLLQLLFRFRDVLGGISGR
jgi:hypothetical protein